MTGRFRAEGKTHLPKWQPEVWNHENFVKGGESPWRMGL